jgi:hypothetical protein
MIKPNKAKILRELKDEFGRWEELLQGLTIEQITEPLLPDSLSIKDTIGHLRAWQQRTIARLEAALDNQEPELPTVPEGLDPDSEEDTDNVNAWIQSIYALQPWGNVYPLWKEGFLRTVQLGEEIPEGDFFDAQKYPWLQGFSVADVLLGTYEHHHVDHYEPIVAWLEQRGIAGPGA